MEVGGRRSTSMAENKTKPTGASVEDSIASRAKEQQQRADCQELMALLERAEHRWLRPLPVHL